MRVVVQLERIGDVVQSVPALRVLAKDEDGTLLVVREGLASWARLLVPEGVRVTEIPSGPLDDVRRALAASPRGTRVLDAARVACRAAGLPPVPRVVSLSWDKAGAAVAAALVAAGGTVTGPVRGPDGRSACHGVWALYPIAAVDAKPWGRVHMTDVRRLLAEEAAGTLAESAEIHPCVSVHAGADLALLVPGASSAARVWPACRFAAVARSLAAAGLAPVVVGGPDDIVRAEAIVRASGGAARSLAGRLAPSGLAALVERAAVVVGADTGPVHFASWLGAPTVMLLSGRAHAWETGPVRPGDLALQALPVGASPVGAIGEDLVAAAALSLVEGQPPPAGDAGVRVLSARAAPPEDALGGVVYADGGPFAAARRMLGRLAAVAGRTAFIDRPPKSAAGERGLPLDEAARLAGRAAERACAALDASARRDPLRAAHALADAARLAGEVAQRVEATDGLQVVAALVRLLAAEASDPRASVCASRLARLLADVEASLRVEVGRVEPERAETLL